MAISLAELFTSIVRSTAASFRFNATRLMTWLFPILAGVMIHFFGGIPSTAMIHSSVYVIGLIVPWFLPETKGRRSRISARRRRLRAVRRHGPVIAATVAVTVCVCRAGLSRTDTARCPPAMPFALAQHGMHAEPAFLGLVRSAAPSRRRLGGLIAVPCFPA